MSRRERYVVADAAGDVLAQVCEAVFDVLDQSAVTLRIDAYSDFNDQMPPDITSAEAWLRSRGFTRGEGDPGRRIVFARTDETGWAIARAYAPWSIRTALFDADDVNVATLDDGGRSVVVDLTDEQASLLSLALGEVASLAPLPEPDDHERP
ncbi:MAG TPA: hypothetical protein VHV79_05800 [Mycobacteriales bacterium]|nr:hypothetical protein [Mycobacteriales bacterium]